LWWEWRRRCRMTSCSRTTEQESVHGSRCHCMSIHDSASRYVSTYDSTHQRISVHVNTCQYTSVHLNTCQHSQYVSIPVNKCQHSQYASIPVNRCQNVSIHHCSVHHTYMTVWKSNRMSVETLTELNDTPNLSTQSPHFSI
jgi:hypothetical protein